ncbi:MAG TPA: flippase [Patescibacteria group bacterium]|nr:flippase [Patescibacteria group bacterium]
MSLSNKIAKNTIIQLVGKVASTVLGLFSLALITRYLGQSGYGEYTTIINFLTIFAVFADFGLTLVTVQMISSTKDSWQENKILNNLFTFRLISIVLFLALAPLVLFFTPYSNVIKMGILITAPFFIFPALTQIIVGLLQKRLRMERAVFAEISSRIVLVIAVILVWRLNAGLNGILLATVASGATSFLLHYILAKKFAKFKLAWDFSLWKKIIIHSWPLAVTIVLNLLYLRTDIIFLSIYKSSAEVGLYGAAYKVIDVLTTIPFMFAGLILPILTMAWMEKRRDYYKATLQRSFNFMTILAVPLIVGGVLLSKPVMVAVAGKEFSDSGNILGLLIIAVAFIFLGTMFSHAVIAIDKQKKLIRYYVFTSVTAIIGYLILIPRYSSTGAAIVTIYSEATIAIFSAYCVYKYSHFLPKINVLLKSIVASLVMGFFIYFYPDQFKDGYLNLIILIVLASLVYGLFLFLLGGINIQDFKMMLKKSKKNQSYKPTNDD